MADDTTTALLARKALLEAAYEAVTLGQSYTLGGRALTRANAQWISDELARVEARLSIRSGRSSVSVEFVPR